MKAKSRFPRNADIPDIKVGTMFDTPFESKCVASTEPDELGNFSAYDHEDVECEFNVVMVTKVRKTVK